MLCKPHRVCQRGLAHHLGRRDGDTPGTATTRPGCTSSRTTSARPMRPSSRCWRCNATAWSLQADELLKRIENTPKRRSSMAESFVRLASAQSHEYRVAPMTWHPCCRMPWTTPGHRPAIGVSVTIFQIPHQHPVWATALAGTGHGPTCSTTPSYSPQRYGAGTACTREAPTWIISVRDEGPGIDPLSKTDCSNPSLAFMTRPTPTFLEWAWALRWCTPWSNATAAHWRWRVTCSGPGRQFRLVAPASASD